MSRVERSVTEILRAYAEEEQCAPSHIDFSDAIEAVQALDASLRRVKRKALQEVVETVLRRLQKEHDKRDPGRSMNNSVVRMWKRPRAEGDDDTAMDVEEEEIQVEVKKPPKESPKEKKKKSKSKHAETESTAEADDSESDTTVYKPTLKDLGGVDAEVTQLLELLAVPLAHPEIFLQLGSDIPRGVLLHGPPGCGKTLLANAVANELGCAFLSISAPSVVSGMSGESEKKLRSIFEEAKAAAPCLIFIDEIDAITPKRDSVQREMERRIVAQLLTCMDDVALSKTGGRPVMVIGATNRPDAIDPALRRGGRFDHEIAMRVPDVAGRQRILETLSSGLKTEGGLDFRELARRTPGFVGADLNALVAAAGVQATKRILSEQGGAEDTTQQPDLTTIKNFLTAHPEPLTEEELEPLSITFGDFMTALPSVQPSSRREGFATVPGVTWNDIGAMQPIREELEYAVVGPIRHPEIYAAAGITAPSGVLLWGPPGCGKTLLAKAVANESQATFISVRGPELLNKYVGESERAVRQVFVRARASVPCIIFFDELDALVPRRDDAQSEASARVVNTLLTELDGTGERNGVFVVAATNRPDMIDQAMLRPGRLDKQLFVELPTASERADILKTICKRAGTPLENVDLEQVAHDERCRNFSGADLAALAREAAVMALKRTLSANGSTVAVSEQDFLNAFAKVKPSVNDTERRKYYVMKETLAA